MQTARIATHQRPKERIIMSVGSDRAPRIAASELSVLQRTDSDGPDIVLRMRGGGGGAHSMASNSGQAFATSDIKAAPRYTCAADSDTSVGCCRATATRQAPPLQPCFFLSSEMMFRCCNGDLAASRETHEKSSWNASTPVS